MRYPTIDLGTGQEALEHFKEGNRNLLESHVVWMGEGDQYSVEAAEWLLEALTDIRSSMGPDKLPRAEGGKFESMAAPMVHDLLSLVNAAAGDPGFWRWINFAAAEGSLLELVDWRFSDRKSELAATENYGLGSIWEGMFARLWLRGKIGFEPDAKDPYSIAKRGDQDIWRSHIMRQDYARCPNLARSLVRYQYPDKATEIHPLTILEIRQVAKKLKILNACYAFEILEDKQLVDIIDEIVHEIRTNAELAAD